MDGCCSRAGQGGRPSPVHDMIQPAISPTTPNADMLFPLNSPHRAFRAPQATRRERRGEPDPTYPVPQPRTANPTRPGRCVPMPPAAGCLAWLPRQRAPRRASSTPHSHPPPRGAGAGRAIENASPTAAAADTVSSLPAYQAGARPRGRDVSYPKLRRSLALPARSLAPSPVDLFGAFDPAGPCLVPDCSASPDSSPHRPIVAAYIVGWWCGRRERWPLSSGSPRRG